MKRFVKIAAVSLIIFVIINIAWVIWRKAAYSPYTAGMEKSNMEFSDAIIPRYVYKDSDGFDYSVKYPEYLSLVGNLALGFPGTFEDPFTDSLIIWPLATGGYEFGVIINSRVEGEDGWMFNIDAEGNAIDAEYQPIAEEYQDVIYELLKRAFRFWDIEKGAA